MTDNSIKTRFNERSQLKVINYTALLLDNATMCLEECNLNSQSTTQASMFARWLTLLYSCVHLVEEGKRHLSERRRPDRPTHKMATRICIRTH